MENAALPPDLGPTELRAAVRDRYAAVASEPEGRYPFRVGRDYAEALGYPPELLNGMPSSAVDAFTGVATPILHAALKPGETVLDLGCGGGLDLSLAARAVGSTGRAIGIDMAEPMVERATAPDRAGRGLRAGHRRGAGAGCRDGRSLADLPPDPAHLAAELEARLAVPPAVLDPRPDPFPRPNPPSPNVRPRRQEPLWRRRWLAIVGTS